jgi:hypothetical protein
MTRLNGGTSVAVQECCDAPEEACIPKYNSLEKKEMSKKDRIRLWSDQSNYDIKIQKMTNGYLVHIGCKKFVFVSLEEMLSDLELYFTDREKVVEKYLDDLDKN